MGTNLLRLGGCGRGIAGRISKPRPARYGDGERGRPALEPATAAEWVRNVGSSRPEPDVAKMRLRGYRLDARLRVRGTVRLLIDYDGVLGPNEVQSDATLHPPA